MKITEKDLIPGTVFDFSNLDKRDWWASQNPSIEIGDVDGFCLTLCINGRRVKITKESFLCCINNLREWEEDNYGPSSINNLWTTMIDYDYINKMVC